jgi:hypothetical protein
VRIDVFMAGDGDFNAKAPRRGGARRLHLLNNARRGIGEVMKSQWRIPFLAIASVLVFWDVARGQDVKRIGRSNIVGQVTLARVPETEAIIVTNVVTHRAIVPARTNVPQRINAVSLRRPERTVWKITGPKEGSSVPRGEERRQTR